jgi:CRP/FNR family transcriptional regulator, dissimilatory nitrate respiration regulator
MDTIEQIAAIPLFQGLPRPQLEDLNAIAGENDFGRGEIIFSEGEEATGFYVVTVGRVKIFKLSLEGKEQTLHLLGPGEPFGEVPVFAGKRFPATAEALEDTRVLYFPRDAFVALIQKTPALALNMLAVLSLRLHKFTVLVEDLSLKEVPGRLAAYLLYLSEQQQGTALLALSISKAQLASLLGTIPETLSRIITRMTKEEIIASAGPASIRIVDRDSLEKMARGEMRLSR